MCMYVMYVYGMGMCVYMGIGMDYINDVYVWVWAYWYIVFFVSIKALYKGMGMCCAIFFG